MKGKSLLGKPEGPAGPLSPAHLSDLLEAVCLPWLGASPVFKANLTPLQPLLLLLLL